MLYISLVHTMLKRRRVKFNFGRHIVIVYFFRNLSSQGERQTAILNLGKQLKNHLALARFMGYLDKILIWLDNIYNGTFKKNVIFQRIGCRLK